MSTTVRHAPPPPPGGYLVWTAWDEPIRVIPVAPSYPGQPTPRGPDEHRLDVRRVPAWQASDAVKLTDDRPAWADEDGDVATARAWGALCLEGLP